MAKASAMTTKGAVVSFMAIFSSIFIAIARRVAIIKHSCKTELCCSACGDML